MERFITKDLISWKDNPNRKPLILRGVRQVGKTWSVEDFGVKYFTGRIHIVDLEKHPEWHAIFDKNLDVNRIVSELEIFLNIHIEPGKDLLFFDEIQSCPRAIMALRYFYEDMPELHVIAAGSLLEFALKDISFPVGRVQFLNMFPLSFAEFLTAIGKDKLAEIIIDYPKQLSDFVHQILMDELKNFFFIGGMPECVKSYSSNARFKAVFEIQTQLIDTFRQDFSKYAPYADKRCLNAVLTNTAKSTGQQTKYTKLAEGFSSPTNKKAFDLLTLARLVHKIPAASPAGLPLGASASARKFKTIMVDIGLMHHLCGLNISDEFAKKNLLTIYQGAMAEQFVGQEFLAAGNELFYWSRDAKSSSAEVDFLFSKKGNIYPVEVKSGASGKLKSMHLLLQNFSEIQNGYVLSGVPFSELVEQKLIFIPLYHAYSIAR